MPIIRKIQYQAKTEPVLATPETVTESRWHQPLSEPRFDKVRNWVAIALAASGLIFCPVAENYCIDSTDSAGTAYNFNKKLLQSGLTLGSISPSIPATSLVELGGWANPNDPGLAGAEIANYVIRLNITSGNSNIVAATQIIRTDSSGTFQTLSSPTTQQPITTGQKVFKINNADLGIWGAGDRLFVYVQFLNSTGSPQSFTLSLGDSITTVAVTPLRQVPGPDTWFASWRDPVWSKPALSAANQKGFVGVDTTVFSPPIPEDRWHQPWSDPVRLKPRLIESAQQFFTTENLPLVSFSWFWELSEPVRLKVGLPASAQQTFPSFGPIKPEVSFSWFDNLSEPVRFKSKVAEGAQQTAAFFPTPIVPRDWYQWLAEPVRKKAALGTGLQQAFWFTEFVFSEPVHINWYAPLTEPVRFKLAVPAFEQHFFEFQPAPFISFGWYARLSEPVRLKPALRPGLQQTLLQVITPHTIYLAATETPDVMAASIARFTELFGANVSVVEVKPNFAYMSSAIQPTVFANVGITIISS